MGSGGSGGSQGHLGGWLSLLPLPTCVVSPRRIGAESKGLSPEPFSGPMTLLTVRAVPSGGHSVAGAVTVCPAWL